MSERATLFPRSVDEQQRIALACKMSMIYPWTWYVQECCSGFTVIDGDRIIQKEVAFSVFSESVHPDDRKQYAESLDRVIGKGMPDFFVSYRSNFFSDDQTYCWYEMKGEVSETDCDGKCRKVTGILKNITEKLESAKELLRVKEMLEFSLKASGTVAWEVAPRERTYFARALSGVGHERKMPIESYISEYIHPDFKAYVLKKIGDLLEGRQDTLDITVRGITSLTQKQTMEWLNLKGKAIPLDVSGRFGFFGTIRIVTEVMEREVELIRLRVKAEQSNLLKSAFLANISHEIRTPLNAIVGFSELMSYATKESEKEEYSAHIQRNNELLLQLISDALDLSKMESGSLEFFYEEVNVEKLCREVVAKGNTRAEAKVAVILETLKEGVLIRCDKIRLSQVLLNLVSNALKFTLEGEIRIGYGLSADGRDIEFYVQDTGIGISTEDCMRVFDRFVKINSFVQGTGLGLPICKSIVEQLGGKIGVESKPGEGTKFWFVIPCRRY